MRDHVQFLGAFVKRPFDTGAVAPSSARLAERMAEGMGLEAAETVVELGPGTGVFTRTIEAHLKPEAHLLCLEINPQLAEMLAARFPRAQVVNDCAENLTQHLKAGGRSSPDCVISGLPWVAFSPERQERLLGAVVAALRPGGRFATFAYLHAAWLPPGRRFRRLLESNFPRVESSAVVWRNLPPAFVYRCQK
ncbi:MAG TPA: methyltransferase domain-containing protein [Vicinamibacteria bacterium]|nr:methyltransferase domain-containing protein [Vicinamibacteria bacterium]